MTPDQEFKCIKDLIKKYINDVIYHDEYIAYDLQKSKSNIMPVFYSHRFSGGCWILAFEVQANGPILSVKQSYESAEMLFKLADPDGLALKDVIRASFNKARQDQNRDFWDYLDTTDVTRAEFVKRYCKSKICLKEDKHEMCVFDRELQAVLKHESKNLKFMR